MAKKKSCLVTGTSWNNHGHLVMMTARTQVNMRWYITVHEFSGYKIMKIVCRCDTSGRHSWQFKCTFCVSKCRVLSKGNVRHKQGHGPCGGKGLQLVMLLVTYSLQFHVLGIKALPIKVLELAHQCRQQNTSIIFFNCTATSMPCFSPQTHQHPVSLIILFCIMALWICESTVHKQFYNWPIQFVFKFNVLLSQHSQKAVLLNTMRKHALPSISASKHLSYQYVEDWTMWK